MCEGWWNDKSTFVCGLTSTKRGDVPPLSLPSTAATTTHHLASALLTNTGILGKEYLAMMTDLVVRSIASDPATTLHWSKFHLAWAFVGSCSPAVACCKGFSFGWLCSCLSI